MKKCPSKEVVREGVEVCWVYQAEAAFLVTAIQNQITHEDGNSGTF
jgi:hypothetical protein